VTLRSYRVLANWAGDLLHGRAPDTSHTGTLIH
jgi:hypothetical protein